jgi:ankyrin
VVKLLLKKRNTSDQPDSETKHNKALNLAFLHNRDNVVRCLIEEGADPNTIINGYSLLCKAANDDKLELVSFLIEKGADPGILRSHDSTFLHDVARQGDIELLPLLLSKEGADPDIKTRRGRTPLYEAVVSRSRNKIEVVRFLLAKKADPNIKIEGGSTLLHAVVRQGDVELLRLLLENPENPENPADPHIQMSDGSTLLHAAVPTGNINVVQLLLEQGLKINSETKDGTTPLKIAKKIAKKYGYTDLVKFLKDKGAKDRGKLTKLKDAVLKKINPFKPSKPSRQESDNFNSVMSSTSRPFQNRV